MDSGASVNIVSSDNAKILHMKVTKCSTTLCTYNAKTSLPVVGKFRAQVSYKGNCEICDFIIVEGKVKVSLKESFPELKPSFDHEAMYFRDYEQKNKIKLHADDRWRTKHNDLKVGDHVLVTQPKLNKFSTPFSPKLFRVKQTKHSLVTAENDDKTITRNASFFKKIHPGTDLSEITNISGRKRLLLKDVRKLTIMSQGVFSQVVAKRLKRMSLEVHI